MMTFLNAWENYPLYTQLTTAIIRRSAAAKQWFARTYYVYWMVWAVVLADMLVSRHNDSFIRELGRHAGELAVLFYLTSLVPGILRRLDIWPRTRTVFMLWRQPFGITMFYLAVTHLLWVRLLPIGLTHPALLLFLSNSLIFGLIALVITTLLWTTSNHRSENTLGKWWKRLHNCTHVLVWLVTLHIWLGSEGRPWAMLATLVAGADAISWIKSWLAKSRPAVV
jgi:DMSO/TMAO reductase YedYZ heme-binding membrane subunit